MKLNHVDLQVADVPRSVQLFEELFGFHTPGRRDSPAVAILEDGTGFVLVLQKKKDPSATYPEGFHFGFYVDDVSEVHALHARARSYPGLEVSDVQTNGRGTLVYLRTDDGLLIEVNCRRPRMVKPRE